MNMVSVRWPITLRVRELPFMEEVASLQIQIVRQGTVDIVVENVCTWSRSNFEI